jgi:hypothetical protein
VPTFVRFNVEPTLFVIAPPNPVFVFPPPIDSPTVSDVELVVKTPP